MLRKGALLQPVCTCDYHPQWSLSCPPSLSPLLLIGCLETRIKYRPSLSKLSILFIQSLSVFFTTLSFSFVPLLLLLPFLPLFSLPLFLFAPSLCQFPTVGTLGISDEEMENIPRTAQATVVKGDFHNESLDDPVKESAGRLCAHPLNTKGPRSALCSFIQLGAPPCSEGSPSP